MMTSFIPLAATLFLCETQEKESSLPAWKTKKGEQYVASWTYSALIKDTGPFSNTGDDTRLRWISPSRPPPTRRERGI